VYLRAWLGASSSAALVAVGCSSPSVAIPSNETQQNAAPVLCPLDAAYQSYAFCSICGSGASLTTSSVQQWACSVEHARAMAEGAAPTCAVRAGACPLDGGAGGTDAAFAPEVGSPFDATTSPAPDPVSDDAGAPLDSGDGGAPDAAGD
jgi:hypothetical protein